MLRKAFPVALVLAVCAFATARPAAVETVGAMEFATQSAETAKGFLCGVLVDVTTQSHAVLSSSGQEDLHCSSDSPFVNPFGQTRVFNGLLCGLFFGGLTTNSHLVINNNEANLWCKG